jgi:transposase InsO family protein
VWVILARQEKGLSYNRERPHSALGYEPPQRFARWLGSARIR